MKWCKEKVEECEKWVEEHGLSQHGGATLYEFCHAMDIDNVTFYRWMENAEFADAIKRAKATFKAKMTKELVNALTRKALGYEDEKTEMYGSTDSEGKFHTDKAKRTKVNVPPDTGACIFLLTNLDPDNYKNRQDTNMRAEVQEVAPIEVADQETKEALEQARNGVRRKK